MARRPAGPVLRRRKPRGRRRQYRHRGRRELLATVPNAVNASLYDKLNFNFIRGIAPVAGIIRVPMVILVHPSVPAKTVPEFIS
jgi:tripartite-type tricarboxylate transporter receptor subunit TctC